jgi:hypothetical protein
LKLNWFLIPRGILIKPEDLQNFTATAKVVFSSHTGFIIQLMACETNHLTKVVTKLNADLLQQNLLFFPIKLFGNQWSLVVAIALPCIEKTTLLHQCCAILILLEIMATKML